MHSNRTESRRAFLRFLATSPLAVWPASFAGAFPERAIPDSLRQVLNIFQLDSAARRALPPEAYHFIVGAADDGATKRANREAYARVQVRPRRLVDVSRVDTGLKLFGRQLASPILLAPVGNQQRIHAEGELASARAAADAGHTMICSMMSNASVGEITAVPGQYWFQLYPSTNRDFMQAMLAAAEASNCAAVVLTIDGPTRGNHEAERWFRLRGARGTGGAMRMGNFEAFDGPARPGDPSFTWTDLDWLRSRTPLPVVLKGIVTREDARLCRKEGVDGVIVSNHGGRQQGSGRGTLNVLPEVADELRGRMPLLLDGGIRRGSDAFKALALGADAVCVGRPYLWGLGAYGEAGVAKALDILQRELLTTMRYAGTTSLEAIQRAHVWNEVTGLAQG